MSFGSRLYERNLEVKLTEVMMCLAIPGKVLEIDRSTRPLMGTVNFGGIQKQICLEWIPDVTVGEYVIVHVGFAISKMDEAEAQETLKLITEIDETLDDSRELGDKTMPSS